MAELVSGLKMALPDISGGSSVVSMRVWMGEALVCLQALLLEWM
ncbi:MAG TPA: hypothetical protein ACQGQH_04240 [Xylella sp.]